MIKTDWETYIAIVLSILILNAPFYIELGKIKTKVDLMWMDFIRRKNINDISESDK